MRTSTAEQIKLPSIRKIAFSKDSMHVSLSDGRVIAVPLAWYPSLAQAKKGQLEKYEISPSGYGLHWPEIDEDLSVRGFIFPDKT